MAGAAADAILRIVSASNDVDRTQASVNGRATFGLLPLGPYRVTATHRGFATTETRIDVRSEVPQTVTITLEVAPVQSVVNVTEDDTLLNFDRPMLVQTIGQRILADRRTPLPSRGVADLVDTQPGWLMEANGVLHPRGSQYDLQYVLDGFPIYDNRSPAFAPSYDVEAVESMNVRTGGYPAEFGRKLGGVVELTTQHDGRQGFHGRAIASGGSYDTAGGFVALQYGWGRNLFTGSGEGFGTNRYLDPPVVENHTNRGTGGGAAAQFERDFSDHDRMRMSVRQKRAGLLVPNDYIQQAAGQRQDRSANETAGQLGWQHVFSPTWIGNFRAMGRDVSARLWSNPQSAPIRPSQDRGFREAYFNGSASAHLGQHKLKFGAEAIFGSIYENFAYRITSYRIRGIRVFDSDTPANFAFRDRASSREQSAYLQDQIRFGNLIVNAGIRWDRYSLKVTESAWSPRVAAAWSAPSHGLTFRASYDRAFITPAIENLLLTSADSALAVGEEAIRLPVRPSRANYYEVGGSKTIFSKARIDVSAYRRNARNFADDEVFLNTGVGFQISFDRATVQGIEAKLEIPRLWRFSGFASYANLNAKANLPITGGLFLQDEAGELLESNAQFRITQDQRNTARTRWRFEAAKRLWFAAGAQYGSGLPVELEDDNEALWEAQYGDAVVDKVNLSRERVRPNFQIDLSVGASLIERERGSLKLQFDAFNVTNRLNVINFAGLLSGTALNVPRSALLRLEAQF